MVRIGVCVCNRSKDVPKMFESIFTMFFSKNPAFVVQSFVQRTFKDFQLFFKDFFHVCNTTLPEYGTYRNNASRVRVPLSTMPKTSSVSCTHPCKDETTLLAGIFVFGHSIALL